MSVVSSHCDRTGEGFILGGMGIVEHRSLPEDSRVAETAERVRVINAVAGRRQRSIV